MMRAQAEGQNLPPTQGTEPLSFTLKISLLFRFTSPALQGRKTTTPDGSQTSKHHWRALGTVGRGARLSSEGSSPGALLRLASAPCCSRAQNLIPALS